MFSAAVLDHFYNPRNVGPLEDATHFGVAGSPGDGPYMQFWLLVEGDLIRQAAYATYGCPAAVACGSVLASVLRNRTLEEAREITAGDVVLLLGGLPDGKEHCSTLTVAALGKALGTGPVNL